MLALENSMREIVLKGITNDTTVKTYKREIGYFIKFAEERGVTDIKQLPSKQDRLDLINAYSRSMSERKLSDDTIHDYLVPVWRGLGIGAPKKGCAMEGIEKPKRRGISIKKGRMPDLVNERGQDEKNDPKYQRIVKFAEVVGMRKSEYGKLRAISIGRDVCGHPCIEVKGKGGKVQRQVIDEKDMERVKQTVGNLQGRQKIFESYEVKNHIDMHSIRREHARDMYEKACQRIRAGEGEKIRNELRKYWDAYHPPLGNRKEYEKNLTEYHGLYRVRGENVARAIAEGRPLVYDRLAVMYVSVCMLAHWRPDVTVEHYML